MIHAWREPLSQQQSNAREPLTGLWLPSRRVLSVMRPLFPLGSLLLLLSGSAVAPAIQVAAKATTLFSAESSLDGHQAGSAIEVAIREAEGLAPVSAPPLEPVLPQPTAPVPVQPRVVAVSKGQASWYGPGFFGNRTANGEVFRPGSLTAAHRTLPFGTRVRVTNLWNGRAAVVRINDRGPFHGNRIIDLAHGAAGELGLISSGVAKVKLEVLR